MNIHVARTPPFRTDSTHTCCQGKTSGLTVSPDIRQDGQNYAKDAMYPFKHEFTIVIFVHNKPQNAVSIPDL